MAPPSPLVQQNGASKAKRPVPPGIQTNGAAPSASSPSPSMSAKKPPPSAKQTPTSAGDRTITASTVRPVNRARREASSQASPGRSLRNSAGLRSASFSAMAASDALPPPYVVADHYILKKFAGRPPSLVIHLHPTHFRFDSQDGMFQYKSPMRLFLEHLRNRTIPHELLDDLNQAKVPFYDGRLIVQVHDHKSSAQNNKDVAKSPSASSTVVPSSIHNYNQCLTPSPFVPFPKDEQQGAADASPKEGHDTKGKAADVKGKETMPAPGLAADGAEGKAARKPKVYTVILHPTSESLHADLRIRAVSSRGPGDGCGSTDTAPAAQPSTPLSLVPPTPTAPNMPPPAKRFKERADMDVASRRALEGQILLATTAPLYLKPTKSVEETIALLEAYSHPQHSEPPPQPKTRKRTVAEMAADEAAAAEQERYMLVLDDRLSSSVTGAQAAGGADGDAPTGSSTFEPRFERFKVIEDIKREQAEKKEQERIKQAENDRRFQLQKQQEATQRQEAEADKARREAAAARQHQIRQMEAQRQAVASRAASATAASQNNGGGGSGSNTNANAGQPQHSHPVQNGGMPAGMPNGVAGAGQNPIPNGMQGQGQAQPRFQAQMSQAAASSPVIRQGTPQQNMLSPMVGGVAMQQTNSNMAAGSPRPSSVVQNAQMSVPMAHNMSARGSQQSHPSGTPRMPHATPNMAHGTPISRPAMAATPRMSQASPPPNMMAQNSQMGQAMMMNSQAMNHQHNPQVYAQMAAQQRVIAQQQHMAAMQNGQAMSPQQQQMMQMMQRQMMLQQQQQQHQQQHQQQQQQQQQHQHQHQQQVGMMTPQQQQQLAQYAQQLQGMPANLRQMSPQIQSQLQHMARMGQMGNPMQRQVNGPMMNGNNVNMQSLAAMQMQQQQQQHPHQPQHQHQQPHQQGQPQQMGTNLIQAQIQNHARQLYSRLVQNAAAKFGGAEHIPPDVIEKMKQSSFAQAQQALQHTMAQRRMQQQTMQQQQAQQAAMQGMGGMMGPQGM